MDGGNLDRVLKCTTFRFGNVTHSVRRRGEGSDKEMRELAETRGVESGGASTYLYGWRTRSAVSRIIPQWEAISLWDRKLSDSIQFSVDT